MTITIRRAAEDDVADIQYCVEGAYRHYIPRIGKPPGPMLVDYAAAIAGHQVWVAEREGAITGLLVLIPGTDHMLLDNIAVLPDAQGQGIGRQLLDLADREAVRQGFSEIRLYTHVRMTENIALYQKLGWEETGRALEDGFERVFFRRIIPSA